MWEDKIFDVTDLHFRAGGEDLEWRRDAFAFNAERMRSEDGYHRLFRSGLAINDEGEIDDVFAGSPADIAGLAPGSRVVAVDHFRFTPPRLLMATGVTELIIEQEDFFWTRQLEIPEGGDFPTLERIEDRPNLLAEVFEPRRSSTGTQ